MTMEAIYSDADSSVIVEKVVCDYSVNYNDDMSTNDDDDERHDNKENKIACVLRYG